MSGKTQKSESELEEFKKLEEKNKRFSSLVKFCRKKGLKEHDSILYDKRI